MAHHKSLADLNVNESARIVEIACQADLRKRLLEIGFVPGTSVRACRFSPLGDPVLFEVRGCNIALRRLEAGKIIVK